MARWRNLRDPVIPDTNRRVRDLEAGSPIGFSSVERGGLRIASDQGLLVEGQALITGLMDVTGVQNVSGLLDGSGTLDWTGPSRFAGRVDVTGRSYFVGDMDVSGHAEFTGDVEATRFRVESDNGQWATQINDTGMHVVQGQVGQPQTFVYTLNGNGASFNSGDVKMRALDDAAGASSMNVILMDSSHKLWRGPEWGGSGGGEGGPGDPGDPGATGLVTPFPWSTVTSEFGWRLHPVYGDWRFHQGIDYGIGCGTPVGSAGPGVVTRRGWYGGWGNSVDVTHDGGIVTRYNHLSGYAVSVGQSVNQRQTVGYVGTTGTSTGCHLDLNVIVGGEFVNPRSYLT